MSTPSGKPRAEEVAEQLGLSFWIENRDGTGVLVHSQGGVRPATLSEVELWYAISRAVQDERDRIRTLAINIAHGYQRNPAAACVLRDFAQRIREGER